MTNVQKLTIRSSEIRARLNVIAGLSDDDMTDEIRGESDRLTTEYADTETKLRAAIAAEPNPAETRDTEIDAEARERLALRGRASFGRYLAAALAGRLPAGAEAEYGEACGAPAGAVPLELFESDRPAPVEHRAVEHRAVEHRADTPTPAPATGTGVTVAPISPFVFAESIAPMLGISMPAVGSGAYSELTISTAATAGAKAKDAAQESTAAALAAVTAKPRRIAARLTLRVEDIAEIGAAGFESALRENTRAALSAKYDDQCINGDGVAPNVNGLIAQLAALDDPTDPTAIASFDAFVAAFADQIDGSWSRRMSDVLILTNVDAYKLSAKTFRDKVIDATNKGAASLGSVSVADYLAAKTGGWSASARMPDTASTIARGIIYRRGRPGLRTAVHPTWGSMSIDDPYTDAAKGIKHVTVSVLAGDRVMLVQPAAYGLVEFKVAA